MDDVAFFWDGWQPIVRIALITTLGYVWLVLLVRGTGQRTLSKMTPFDFLITVTLGSAFGRVITAREVSVVEVVVAFAVLVSLQWLAAMARSRSSRVSKLIEAEPALLYLRGRQIHKAMHRHRITESDLEGAARQHGMGSLDEVVAIVLEPGGTFSVLGGDQLGDESAVPVPPD